MFGNLGSGDRKETKVARCNNGSIKFNHWNCRPGKVPEGKSEQSVGRQYSSPAPDPIFASRRSRDDCLPRRNILPRQEYNPNYPTYSTPHMAQDRKSTRLNSSHM